MHAILEEITHELELLVEDINSKITSEQLFAQAHGNNWSIPSINKYDLIDDVKSLINDIESQGMDNIDEGYVPVFSGYPSRVQHIRQYIIPQLWQNPAQGVTSFYHTIRGLRTALQPALSTGALRDSIKNVTRRIRAIEARTNDIEPRTTSISDMVDRIEQAHDAADQLPTDLESLKEAKSTMEKLCRQATIDQSDIAAILEQAEAIEDSLKRHCAEAESTLERCESAYSAATSVGLAAAFSERSHSLSRSMWIWVVGLITALTAGSFLGSMQLHALSESLKNPETQTPMLVLNVALSLLSIGAPVWFAWLATKQIGHRFKLAEDYAFKASVSRAYEGYRKEAARVDKDMEAQLLSSALSRLDELPLRLVESETHGSPWQEAASSDLVKQAFKTIPGFADQVRHLATQSLDEFGITKRKNKSSGTTSQITEESDEVI
ncbi:hypothetical protein [Marinobacterium stanieri]|uniref:Uncharacterized protein n=1 Tax=Marinobacterium stanieri TaxID=49186 RepID=A0A1N6XX24_9GAMM|nr:hypothetical protein [Marinobacterium stanieri]SIR06783.1 hypothetical protein SAMN05421647_1183 [Marinobacterium stanieri]